MTTVSEDRVRAAMERCGSLQAAGVVAELADVLLGVPLGVRVEALSALAHEFCPPPVVERPAGDAGSAALRIVLAVHGLDREATELALADACHRLGVRLVPEPYQTPPGALDPHGDRRRHDGGHVSGILARVVDLLAQCSGNAERRQVLNGAAAFHELTDRPED